MEQKERREEQPNRERERVTEKEGNEGECGQDNQIFFFIIYTNEGSDEEIRSSVARGRKEERREEKEKEKKRKRKCWKPKLIKVKNRNNTS